MGGADIYQDFQALSVDSIFQGREPQRENEIVVTTVVAERFSLEVGDSVQVRAGDKEESYIVCGISQQISNMGLGSRMTKEAIARICPEFHYSKINLYVNREAATVAEVVERLEEAYKADTDLKISNYDESFVTTMESFSNAIMALCLVAVIITLVVVYLMIVMIMKMKMVRQRKNIGIYKALGYTTRQVVWQMVMAFAPVVALGGILGSLIGALSVEHLFAAVLSFCGIRNVSLHINIEIVAACILGIAAVAFAVSAMISAKARKIEPYKMIVEE